MLEHLVSSWGITVFRAAMYIGEGGYASDNSAGCQVLTKDARIARVALQLLWDWGRSIA